MKMGQGEGTLKEYRWSEASEHQSFRDVSGLRNEILTRPLGRHTEVITGSGGVCTCEVYILASPFYASTYFTNLWYFGDVGCRVISAVDVLTLNASTFTLTVMCLERYLAVVDPIKSLKCRSVSLSRVLSGVIWVLAMGLSLPMALSTELQELRDGVMKVTIDVLDFSNCLMRRTL
ncbi:SSTR5 [Branchiostoma lanceolatum]|uniref:SSTR5 protein n=1 Tax=Branchiostoma lanceolatum TaxID=7740 RepID=A0A8K0AFK5_BRALA|nr:SSTR5 [Branchiostoma lanceolatum]